VNGPRVLLIRHGRSAFVHRDGWVNADGLRRWRERYDAADIIEGDKPPKDVLIDVARADLVVASDLPRAVGSAKRLAPDREIVITPIMRETPQPIPAWMRWRLPAGAWHSLVALTWFWQILRGTDATPEEIARAATAADWLTRQAREHGTVAAVTHGVFRRLVGQKLVADGWRAEPRRRGYNHWSVWPFTPR